MTIALVHYPIFVGESQLTIGRVRYHAELLCGWDTEPGTLISTEVKAVTCEGCSATLAGQPWRYRTATTMP